MRIRYFCVLLGAACYAAPPGPYRIDTAAGSSLVGDGGPAAEAPLKDAQSIAVDRAGNLWIADAGDHRVRQVSASGIISTFTGNSFPGYAGDNGPAAAASLNLPYGVAVDPSGNVFIADLGNNCVRRVAAGSGVITTALNKLLSPRNTLADSNGNIYVSEFAGHRIRRINPDGASAVIAGTGTAGSDGDGGLATQARISYPAGMAIDRAGNFYFADSGNNKIRKITNGVISTVLGTGVAGMGAPGQLGTPTGVAVDSAGNLYVADSGNQRIRKLTPAGVISTIAVAARDVAIAPDGNLLAANGPRVVKILSSGAVATIAGDSSYFFRGDGGPAINARLNSPAAAAVDANGNLWIADKGNARIRVVDANGIISTLAGPAGLTGPASIGFDSTGNALIADPASNQVRRLTGSTLSLAAGNGFSGYTGESYLAIYSSLAFPSWTASRPDGGFYIADTANHRIRIVNAGGVMTTIAGTGVAGWNGDGVSLGAALNSPSGVAIDAAGAVYVSDTMNNRIRKITSDGQIATVAGPPLNAPHGLAFDDAGNLWIADTGNHRIAVLAPDHSLTVIAGAGVPGFGGDGGPALNAQFNAPTGVFPDPSSGSVYVADSGNQRIRRLSPAPGGITEAPPAGFTVVNAATLQAGPAAPCSQVSLFGAGLGSASVQITFDGQAQPVLASQYGQATVQVPCSLAPAASTQLEVVFQGTSLGKVSVPIVQAAPGMFTLSGGTGQALALNQDGTVNSTANPAPRGSIVTFYVTGIGQGDTVSTVVNATASAVLFSGDAPGQVGVTQINAQLPPDATGVVNVLALSGLTPSQDGVTIAIQ